MKQKERKKQELERQVFNGDGYEEGFVFLSWKVYINILKDALKMLYVVPNLTNSYNSFETWA